jgi:hypothetical protein
MTNTLSNTATLGNLKHESLSEPSRGGAFCVSSGRTSRQTTSLGRVKKMACDVVAATRTSQREIQGET